MEFVCVHTTSPRMSYPHPYPAINTHTLTTNALTHTLTSSTPTHTHAHHTCHHTHTHINTHTSLMPYPHPHPCISTHTPRMPSHTHTHTLTSPHTHTPSPRMTYPHPHPTLASTSPTTTTTHAFTQETNYTHARVLMSDRVWNLYAPTHHVVSMREQRYDTILEITITSFANFLSFPFAISNSLFHPTFFVTFRTVQRSDLHHILMKQSHPRLEKLLLMLFTRMCSIPFDVFAHMIL